MKLDLPKSPMCIFAFTHKKRSVMSVKVITCFSWTFWSLTLMMITFNNRTQGLYCAVVLLLATMIVGLADHCPCVFMYPTLMHPHAYSLSSAVKSMCNSSCPLWERTIPPVSTASLRARAVWDFISQNQSTWNSWTKSGLPLPTSSTIVTPHSAHYSFLGMGVRRWGKEEGGFSAKVEAVSRYSW